MTPDGPGGDETTRQILAAAEAQWRAERDLDQARLLRVALLLVLVLTLVVLAVVKP